MGVLEVMDRALALEGDSMRIRLPVCAIILVLLSPGSVQAQDATPADGSVIPKVMPNPFKHKTTEHKPLNYAEHLGKMEKLLYGELNADKSDEIRLSALERTTFGASSSNPKYQLSMKTRIEGLARVINALVDARSLYEEERYAEAKKAFEELIRLMGTDYKSTAKAECYYRLGMCDYQLSNVAANQAPAPKVDGPLLRSAKINLTKAQDYYNALGQEETAKKITAFIDTFREEAAKSFLY